MTSPVIYFANLEINHQPVDELGRMDPITKQFGAVTVTLSMSSSKGPYLNFQGLKIASSITIRFDYEQLNEIVHLYLTGDAHMVMESV